MTTVVFYVSCTLAFAHSMIAPVAEAEEELPQQRSRLFRKFFVSSHFINIRIFNWATLKNILVTSLTICKASKKGETKFPNIRRNVLTH